MNAEEILGTWADKRLNEKSVNEALLVDGIPLWWVFERFITNSLLPKPFASFNDISKGWAEGIAPSGSWIKRAVMTRAFIVQERLKWRSARKLLPTPAKKILFLTYSNHIFHEHGTSRFYRTDAVIKKLKEDGSEPFVVVIDPLSKRRSSTTLPMIYDFMSPEVKRKAKIVAGQLAENWRGFSLGDKLQLMMDADKSLYPYVRDHIEFFFSEQFLRIFLTYYFAIKDMVALNNVRAIYLTASIGLFEKCCLMIGKLLDIAVYVAQHGSGVGFGKVHSKLMPAAFLVFGEKHKELLLAQGVAANRIIVTGSPMVDEIVPAAKSKGLTAVLLLTQPFVEDALWTPAQRTEFFSKVHEMRRVFAQVTFTIKIHPRENKELYEKEFLGIRIADTNLYDEIKAADLVVGVTSTALMESVLLNRPVIVLDLFSQATAESHVALGLSKRVIEIVPEDIEDYITFYRSAAFDRKRDEYVKMYFHKLDGKSAQRIAAIITDQL